MKRFLFSLFAITMVYVNAQVDEHGYKTVELTTGAAYSNRVFFDLSSENLVSQNATNWDVAFWRKDMYEFGTRVNDAYGMEIYEASANPADWNAINIANIGSWGDPLYNPDQTTFLNEGAFEQGSITSSNPNIPATGWGIYNAVNHHIEGKVIFVMKYPGDVYYKFFIEDYFGGYTFKYAKWNGTSWDATQTKTIANGSGDTYFNYFSFTTNDVVANNEPAMGAWDLVFTRYWTFYNNVMMYRMAGVIQSPDVSIVKKEETQATSTVNLPADSDYSDVITTIGHSWKPTSGVYDNVVYYIKQGEDVYRLYFIENGGQANGNMFFKYKKVAGNMSVADVELAKVQVYPNPVVNQLNVSSESNIKEVKIFSVNGQLVSSVKPNSKSTSVNVSALKTGVYVAQIITDNGVQTAKVIKK